MRKIKIGPIKNTDISLPGSKSYTHRMLIAAAFSEDWCRIHNPLESEDTNYTRQALAALGAKVEKAGAYVDIKGTGGRFQPVDEPIDLGNSGTSMRLLTGVVALGQGSYELTGTDRMKQRPIKHLLDALHQIGVQALSINGNGCPPVRVNGGKITGGEVKIDCSISSQFLSSLLLMAPLTGNGLSIQVVKGPVSKPYIDMTVDVLNQFGIKLERQGYNRFDVKGSQTYQAGEYTVEPDASQASYFWAAAAVTGAVIKVKNITSTSLQGDVRFVRVLEQMGCRVKEAEDGISVAGGPLSGIDTDMSDMPDLVPTLAVVAAFAKGQTVIRNVGHLRDKESDRLSAVQNELNKIDISADTQDDDLIITGGAPKGGEIDTYDDHRMAMSFAVAGLCTPGIFIKNENCVAKSFPGFWEMFDRMYA
ncbi:MAG: 3-phosphoshikimate 1-carboxyvinyltransferase [Desulfobacterales bacterium]